jgi:hypothetical protein
MIKSLDGLRNLDKKIQKSTHFSIEIETNCRETPKFSDLDEILYLDRDFLVWTLMSRRNISIVETYFLTLSRFSRLSRLTLWRRRDWESRSRPRRDKSRPPGLYKIQLVVFCYLAFPHSTSYWTTIKRKYYKILLVFCYLAFPHSTSYWTIRRKY